MSLITITPIASILIALIALFRPEIWRLLRRWQNRIDFFPQRKIEIGFSSWGPTIGLVGSIRGFPNDQYVKSISIRLVRERDQLSHIFDWAVFRSIALFGDAKDLQIASGFTLRSNDARTLNIQFWDNDTRQEVEASLERLRQSLFDFAKKSNLTIAAKTQLEAQALFQGDFQKAEPNLQGAIWSEIDRKFYWVPGAYRVSLIIETWDPQKTFEQSFRFELTAEEAETIRINIVAAMLGTSGANVHYNFVNPVLNSAS